MQWLYARTATRGAISLSMLRMPQGCYMSELKDWFVPVDPVERHLHYQCDALGLDCNCKAMVPIYSAITLSTNFFANSITEGGAGTKSELEGDTNGTL